MAESTRNESEDGALHGRRLIKCLSSEPPLAFLAARRLTGVLMRKEATWRVVTSRDTRCAGTSPRCSGDAGPPVGRGLPHPLGRDVAAHALSILLTCMTWSDAHDSSAGRSQCHVPLTEAARVGEGLRCGHAAGRLPTCLSPTPGSLVSERRHLTSAASSLRTPEPAPPLHACEHFKPPERDRRIVLRKRLF